MPEDSVPEYSEPVTSGNDRADEALGLLEGLATTRAIRRYTDEPVDEKDLNTILWHASRAPSGSNRQAFRFVVLRDSAVAVAAKELLGNAFRSGWQSKIQHDRYEEGSGRDPRSPKARQAAAMQSYVDHFEDTPVVVLVCLIRHREPNPYEGASVYPACQNLLLAARALGYGGVLTMWHHAVEKELRSLLEIPDGVALSACITLGRPQGAHGPVRRRPLEELVYEDTWQRSPRWANDPPGTSFTGPAR